MGFFTEKLFCNLRSRELMPWFHWALMGSFPVVIICSLTIDLSFFGEKMAIQWNFMHQQFMTVIFNIID
jgi:hypothetical protein